MSNYINQIYSAFHGLPDSYFLIIKGSEEQGYVFAASATYDEAVAIRTQKLFKKIFQEFPIQEILAQCSDSKLTKAVLRQIFVKMAVFEDNGPQLNFSTMDQLENIFLDHAPASASFVEDKAKTSGKGFEGLSEKVYLQWHHYFATQQEEDPEKLEIRQAEFLTSRMADREFQEGTYVYLGKSEVFQVDKTVVASGSYISILKNISDPSKVKIVCRGTAMRRTATDGLMSGLNDLQYEIGNGGIQAAWPMVFEYLSQQNVREIEIYGKSLGGAHAQRLAILIMKLPDCELTSLTTVCSVGAGVEAEALFKSYVEQDKRYHQLRQIIIRNGGNTKDEADYIPCLGGDHLGSTVDAKYLDLRLYYIHPTAAQISPPHDNLNVFQYGMRLAASFSSAHVRQTTFTDFSYQRLDDRVAIQSALNMGLALERPRRWIAYRNKTSFSDFVNPPVKIESLTIEKTVALVSSLFLILFYVGFMVCLVLEPGSIVFQGNGIVLTLAAVIMAAGGGLSVLTIAIASCSWWLSSKENRNADYQTAP